MNPNTNPLQIPNSRRRGQRHEKGNAMSGPPYNSATVQRYDGTTYNVRRTTSIMYDVRHTTGTTYNVQQYDMVTHAE